MRTAIQRYNEQPENNWTMQEPEETRNGLYIWERWTYSKDGKEITDIRYYAEEINGGKTFRISLEDFLRWSKITMKHKVNPPKQDTGVTKKKH